MSSSLGSLLGVLTGTEEEWAESQRIAKEQRVAFLKTVPDNLEGALELVGRFDISTTGEQLEYVLETFYDSLELAQQVAMHPSCPPKLLKAMTYFLPDYASKNPALEALQETDKWTRLGVVRPRNPEDSENHKLSAQGVSAIRPYRFKVCYWLEHGTPADQRYILGFRRLDDDLTEPFCQSKLAPIRKAIAQRKQLSDRITSILIQDKAKSVRAALAKNPMVSEKWISKLADDKDASVRQAALANPNCPQQLVAEAREKAASEPILADLPTQQLDATDLIELLSNQKTTTEKLGELATHTDPFIRAGVALHHNTTPQILEVLSTDPISMVQECVAYNPNTPALSLKQLMLTATPTMYTALAANPATPEDIQLELIGKINDPTRLLLANMAESYIVWEALAKTPAAGRKRKGQSWQEVLLFMLDPASKGLYSYHRQDYCRHLFVGKLAALHPNCTPGMKAFFAYYLPDILAKNPEVALQLLENPSAVSAKQHSKWDITEWLSEENVPGYVVQHTLMGKGGENFKRKMVSSRNTCIGHLQPMAFEKDIHLRKRLLQRKDITAFMLHVLSYDKLPSIRELVAKHTKCPREVLERLGEDKASEVKIAAQAHKKFPKRKNKQKKEAQSPEVFRNKGRKPVRVKMARETQKLSLLEDLALDKGKEVREAVANNPKASLSILRALASDSEDKIRQAVANNPNTSLSILTVLATDNEDTIRQTVAKHQNVNEELLISMRTDRDERVRWYTLNSLIDLNKTDTANSQQIIEQHLSFFYDDNCTNIQRVIALYTMNVDWQMKQPKESTPEVRRALTCNSFLDINVAHKLTKDESSDVISSLISYVTHPSVYLALASEGNNRRDYDFTLNKLFKSETIQQQLLEIGLKKHRPTLLMLAKYSDNKSIIDTLFTYPSEDLFEALSSNESPLKQAQIEQLLISATPTILEYLNWGNDKKVLKLAKYHLHQWSAPTRAVLAKQYELNQAIEAMLLEDPEEEVRAALVENDYLSKEAKTRLKSDPSDAVRDATRYAYW